MWKGGRSFFVAFVLLALVFVTGVYADFDFVDENIDRNYSAGQIITGTINISFDDELVDGLFTSNLEGNISLIDLLNANGFDEGNEYNCSVSSCMNDYSYGSSISGFTLTQSNNEKTAGFVISNKPDVEITGVSYKVQSGGLGESCFRQLTIDVLDNNLHYLTNDNYVNEECFDPARGCFDSSLSSGSYDLATIQTNTEYCEKVNLPPGPAYKLKAKIVNSSQGMSELEMRLYNKAGDFLDKCTLPKLNGSVQEIGCVANFSSPYNREYYACIIAKNPSNYKIKTESVGNVCGTTNPGTTGSVDYDISVRNMKFGVLDFEVNDEKFSKFNQLELGSVTLSEYIDDYVSDVYNRNCQPHCVIPSKFFGIPQGVSFTDVYFEYFSDGTSLESNNFYDVNMEPGTLNSGFLEIDLEPADFEIPLDGDEDRFELSLDDEEILDIPISVVPSFAFDITPRLAAYGQLIEFVAITSGTIVKSEWKFGDGRTGSSNNNRISHRFLQQGNLEMEVTLTRSDGVKGTRSFAINVDSAKGVLNGTIDLYKTRLGRLGSDIESYPKWVQDELKKKFSIVDIEAGIINIESVLDFAVTDDDYNSAMLSLINLDIPLSINVSKKGSLPLIIGFDNINVEYIESLSGKEVDDDQDLKGRISSWMGDNYDAQINIEQLSAFYEDNSEVLLSKFKIETKPRRNVAEEKYLILGYGLEGFRFMSEYNARTISGGTYIILGEVNQGFEFIIPDEIEAEELGAHITPLIDSLGSFIIFDVCNFDNMCNKDLGENNDNCPADCRPWGWFAFWIIILVFGALIVYVILQEWYKRHYEKSLFPNENDLYNLINFIYNARRSGLHDGDVKKKLKKAKWDGEKLRYVFKKIDGQRTGMYEIPLLKFVENKKVKKEIAKRQHGKGVDPMFVRRRRRSIRF